MKTGQFTEDTLVQNTRAIYPEQLGWWSVYAYNREDFGPDSLLGRASDREVVLTQRLAAALNSSLPAAAPRRHIARNCFGWPATCSCRSELMER